MKKILIITYYYWPSSEVGAKRPMRICRELKNSGKYFPILLTTDSKYHKTIRTNEGRSLQCRHQLSAIEDVSGAGEIHYCHNRSEVPCHFRRNPKTKE